MQYLYRPNECQMTFQEAGARQVYGIDCYRRDRKDAPPVAQYRESPLTGERWTGWPIGATGASWTPSSWKT